MRQVIRDNCWYCNEEKLIIKQYTDTGKWHIECSGCGIEFPKYSEDGYDSRWQVINAYNDLKM